MDADSAGSSTTSTAGRWWAPPAPAATDVMNQLCRVCGEPAAGFHFGAFTCEGCKSFFGRTYNNLSSISECKNNNECIINKKNRTSCKACRLRKCLMVGMSKSGSRYGRRSNWFKIHCLLQEQQQHANVNPVAREQLSSKNKVLQTWESINQSFSEKHHHIPSIMDADNNNTSLSKGPFLDGKDRTISPNNIMHKRVGMPPQPHPGYANAGEAAAAFWAARNSLLPLHHPMGPASLGHLPVPFLASPFLHTAAAFHPHSGPPPRNFILPFVQPVPDTRHSNPVERLLSTTASSHSSTASSPSSSPSEKQPTISSERDRETDSVDTDRSSKDHSSVCEKSLATLRALGPVQEQPMDLSLKSTVMKNKSRHKRENSKCSNDEHEDSDSETDNASCDGDDEGDEICESVDRVSKEGRPGTVPLDLSTR